MTGLAHSTHYEMDLECGARNSYCTFWDWVMCRTVLNISLGVN